MKKKDRLLKKNCVGEEEIKETEFKTRSQYKRPNHGDLEPKAYGVWIKKIPKKRGGKKTRAPKQKTQKRNSPKKALKAETKLLCIEANPIESAVAVVAISAEQTQKSQKAKETKSKRDRTLSERERDRKRERSCVLGTRLVLRGGFRCPCLSEMNSRQW
jgi:hypothetical protein